MFKSQQYVSKQERIKLYLPGFDHERVVVFCNARPRILKHMYVIVSVMGCLYAKTYVYVCHYKVDLFGLKYLAYSNVL